MKFFSLLWAMMGMFTSCASSIKDKDWQETSKVVYRHSTPTVAPDYYRSFSVTVTAEEIVVDVRNYSKTLLAKRYTNTSENYQSFIKQLQEAGVKKVKEVDNAAGGGEAESLSLFKGEDEYFSAYESSGSGNLKVANGDLGVLVRRIVPDLDKIIEQTYENVNQEIEQ